MNPVEQLIADLQAGTIETPEALAERIAALSNEELVAFETAALELVTSIADGTTELADGTDRLEALETLATSIEGTRTEAETRINAATDQQAAVDAIVNRVVPVAETDPPEVDPDAPPVDPDAPPADPPADPEAVVDPVVDPALEPVPAAITPPPAAPRISAVAVRRPAERAPQQRSGGSVITAGAEVPGISAGGQIRDFEHLTEVLSARAEATRGLRVAEGTEQRYHVATITASYPAEQDLRAVQHNPQSVETTVTAAIGRNGEQFAAMTAAGGFCAPPTPLYDQISIGDASRPARSALPAFQATRGKVLFMPSPTWTDYAAGVRVWTATNDVEALTNTDVRKPCVRVDCDETTEAEVEAITMCVTVGNFFDRTFDERRQAILDDVMVWQARFAERRLLTKLAAASTTLTTGQTLGTLRDVLAILDRALAGFESRFRVADNFNLELWLPRWLKRNMRVDLVRALPVSGASLQENLAAADATIESLIAARGLNVTWLWDGEQGGTDQEFGAEAGGSLQNWPTRAIGYLFHPGAHRFLDMGTLDLGIVRDSTLNATNDLQIWSETFEGLMSPGLESLRLDMDICPSGEISGTVDVTGAICTTGS